ncbi:hypothetical protein [Cesiribacter sp. SM1]|uniref:hypothetical protein n=1 Tax=Cesiribacter sp. SM1 TaxID=2861196 RepID=UPI001CD30F97|nr:hypothetical protein [Cesiribacter sp. SM1]
MTTLTTQAIYVHLIDGTDTWVPVKARIVQDNQYEILENSEFIRDADPNYLFEFYPGDTVETVPHTFKDGKKGNIAKKLIREGKWQNRKYNEFLYKAILGLLNIDIHTADKYRDEIERVKKENSAGQFFYPAVLNTIVKMDSLTRDKK